MNPQTFWFGDFFYLYFMTEKKKITEIREAYTINKKVRNETGELVNVQQTAYRYKEVNYVDGWARFGGFLLDLVFILIFEAIVGVAIAVLVLTLGDESYIESQEFDIMTRLLTFLVIRPAYYIIFEGSSQASLAKMILGRVVVNEYGEKPSWGQIIGRSYGRIVPFEFFSCLGTLGWHDTWSNTFVLRKKDLYDLQVAMKMQEFGKEEVISPA